MSRLRSLGVVLLAAGVIAVARNEPRDAAALPTRVPSPTYEWHPTEPAPALPVPPPPPVPDLAEQIDAWLRRFEQLGWFRGAVPVAGDGAVLLDWRWDQALDRGDVLSQTARARMFTAHTSAGSWWDAYWGYPYLGYGYGWMVARERRRPVLQAGRRIPGYLTQHIRYVEDGLTLIFLSNQEDALSPKDATVKVVLGG
ncbi:MAG: hypothetical protein GXX93_11435 [Anaerolineae bacterium]|nr:hypothetical protein [Anaerolineae bacterium]